KIRPSTCRASEPKPRRPEPSVTPSLPRSASTRPAKRASPAAGSGIGPRWVGGGPLQLLEHLRPAPPVKQQGDRADLAVLYGQELPGEHRPDVGVGDKV